MSNLYRRSIRTSFFLVVFLVLVGGLVRSTGAGLGCPDWPKCFGLWVPPVHISQVPLEYWNDPLSSFDGQLIFNPIKTWTEYINRLIGVVIGLSILIQAVLSLLVKPVLTARIFSLASLVMVIGQGILGAFVVSSELKPLVISIHLTVAVLIGFSLLGAWFFSDKPPAIISPYPLSPFALTIFILTSFCLIIQFVLGTEVRSQVDALFHRYFYESRHLYAGFLNWIFLFHRSFSLLVLVLLILQIPVIGKFMPVSYWYQLIYPLCLALGLIISGVILAYFNFPSFAQPFHLLFGFCIVCSQFWLFLHFRHFYLQSRASH